MKMGEKVDELGLTLSLSLGRGGTQHCSNIQRPSKFMQNHHQKKRTWNEMFKLFDKNSHTRAVLEGIEVNRVPKVAKCEEENGVSSPDSTITSISVKRNKRELLGGDENEAERISCTRRSDDEEGRGSGGSHGTPRKKLRLSMEQSMVLEETFKEHNTLNQKQKVTLAKKLNLRPRQVEVWFQNRRARTKLKQTEVECEYLKRSCENLTDENMRLHKELQELRALQLSPQLYMQMKNPPTTHTLCTQCARMPASPLAPKRHKNSDPTSHNIQRPMPINLWATLPIQRDAPSSGS